jgi:DNA (cytosine-5)-methyltransferase 1
MNRNSYNLAHTVLTNLQVNKLKVFHENLDGTKLSDSTSIPIKTRGYKVNDVEFDINRRVHAIGCFSGAGGLDVGTQLAGARIISSLDFDNDSVATMKANRFFKNAEHLNDDIQNVTGSHYKEIIKRSNPEKLIMVGGPPCQPFSKAGYWVTHKNRLGSDDPRNMIGQYLRLIGEVKPDGFVLENVESLLHPKNAEAVTALEEAIDALGYHFLKFRADATEFGVPQRRKRVFFIASRKTIIGEPQKTHGKQQDIFNSSKILPIERVIDWIAPFDSELFFEESETTANKTYGHELTEVPPGQNYFALTERENYPNPKFQANKRFWNFLLKLHPLQSSWTISAQPGPWVGPFHWNNRRLRVPEIAAIQTFPQDYVFVGSRRSIQKQIGNAVPPVLGKSIIEFLISQL